jgi:hypothetical protein
MTESPVDALDVLVGQRRRQVGDFMRWAAKKEENPSDSLRWSRRSDIDAAKQAASGFPEQWWGLTVFTCFWWHEPIADIVEGFQRPLDPGSARRYLDRVRLPVGSISNHRTQRGHKGALIALIAACKHSSEFKRILTADLGGFDPRFRALWRLPAPDWGRTTSFDLILRAGAIGVGGHHYAPEIAYLAGSTGPGRGFERVWGVSVEKKGGPWCEDLLGAWINKWREVAKTVGVRWTGTPYDAGDLENALCIYQERGRPCD